MKFTIPMKTPSLGNARMHWAAKAREVQKQKRKTMLLMPAWKLGPMLVVTLTRVSPRELDPGDNLPVSMKAIRDGVASRLWLDDRSPLIRWEYAQEKCKAGDERVEVSIQPNGPTGPRRVGT